MLKNNIKILFYYFFVIILTFGLLIIIDKLYQSGVVSLDNILVKIFFLVIYFIIFILGGKIVNTKQHISKDYLNFILVFTIGMVFYLLSLVGWKLKNGAIGTLLRLPAQVFLSPFVFLASVIGEKFGMIFYVILSALISFLMGLSTRRLRLKKRFKQRR